MAALVFQLILLSLGFKFTVAEGIRIEVIIGPVVAGAVIIELVTILIAVCCCISLKRRLSKSKSFAKSAHEQNSTRSRISHISRQEYDEGGEDDGTKTIRVVHNSLYQSMKSDSGTPMEGSISYDHTFAADSDDIDAPAEQVSRLQLEHDVTKLRSTTQSSHTYEPVSLTSDEEGDKSTRNESTAADVQDRMRTTR